MNIALARKLLWVCSALLLFMVFPARAQVADPPAAAVDTSKAGSTQAKFTGDFGDSTAMVKLRGRELFPVYSDGVLSASERAQRISERIQEVARSNRHQAEEFRVLTDERLDASVIAAGNHFITSVWEGEGRLHGGTSVSLAQERMEIIRSAIQEYRKEVGLRSLLKSTAFALAAVVVLVLLLMLASRIKGRLESGLGKYLTGRTFFKVLTGESLLEFLKSLVNLAHVIVNIWLILMTVHFILSLFPWTYPIASRLFEFAYGPAKSFGRAFVNQLPAFFFLAFIIIVTVYFLRGVQVFFKEVERKRVRIRGFYPDWAHPTFNIVRLVVIAFAFVIAFPYIPGSNSAAFKGMSVFVGVLVSLGSGSAMANIISGVILIYMRPFDIGDRVRVGESVGVVTYRNLLTTRIRTPKNERITIPNTNILSSQIVNYSTRSKINELILHTSVTIGYDVPWRTVHDLLLAAAKATENILEEPEPFVLQVELHDFYVEYEVNAFTDQPDVMPATYSNLHQNIQDKFSEAGVEILSPHYRSLRQDGRTRGPVQAGKPVKDDSPPAPAEDVESS